MLELVEFEARIRDAIALLLLPVSVRGWALRQPQDAEPHQEVCVPKRDMAQCGRESFADHERFVSAMRHACLNDARASTRSSWNVERGSFPAASGANLGRFASGDLSKQRERYVAAPTLGG
jgi:hypothetical protein